MLSIIATLELNMHLIIFGLRSDMVTNFPSRKLSFRVVLLCIRIQTMVVLHLPKLGGWARSWWYIRCNSIWPMFPIPLWFTLFHTFSTSANVNSNMQNLLRMDGVQSLIPESIIRNYVSIDDEIFRFVFFFYRGFIFLFDKL